MSLKKTCTTTGAALLLLAAATGCAASYDERMDYLKKIAQQGVEMHDLITGQEGEPDKKRCQGAFDGVSDYVDDAPYDTNDGARSNEWKAQIKQVFVDSCVSGTAAEADAPGSTESPTDNTNN